MKKFTITASILLLCAIAYSIAEPRANYFRNTFNGVVMAYIAGLGTNSVAEFDYVSNVPCRLSEVNATVGGTEVDVTVSRIWVYHRENWSEIIITNFGYAVTNRQMTGYTTEEITNLVYDSTSDTLPVSGYFQMGDVVQISTGSATGAVVRIIGTAQ
jgi:hypothetical protein